MAHRVCLAQQVYKSSATRGATELELADAPGELDVGTRVEIQNLVVAPAFNGMVGTVCCPLARPRVRANVTPHLLPGARVLTPRESLLGAA